MSILNTDVLSVIDEAIIISRSHKIVFANYCAEVLLGRDITGKKLAAVLGENIACMQADDFTANTFLKGKNFIIRSSRKDRDQIFVIKEVKFNSFMFNDSFLFSLRSSLTIMNMSMEHYRRFAEKNRSEEMLELTDLMNKSLSSVSRLVENISVVSSLYAQSIRFSPKTLDICKLFAEYTDIIASLLPDIEICFEAPEALHTSVDTDLIKLLFTNLVSNSVLHGKCRKLHIRLLDSAEYLFLAVNDDGCGIQNEDLYNVFERYLDRIELKDMSRGAGFGLTVVMGIARLHGGTVLLESRADHGTALRVSLRKNTGGSAFYSYTPSTEDAEDFLRGLAGCVDEKRFRESYSE